MTFEEIRNRARDNAKASDAATGARARGTSIRNAELRDDGITPYKSVSVSTKPVIATGGGTSPAGTVTPFFGSSGSTGNTYGIKTDFDVLKNNIKTAEEEFSAASAARELLQMTNRRGDMPPEEYEREFSATNAAYEAAEQKLHEARTAYDTARAEAKDKDRIKTDKDAVNEELVQLYDQKSIMNTLYPDLSVVDPETRAEVEALDKQIAALETKNSRLDDEAYVRDNVYGTEGRADTFAGQWDANATLTTLSEMYNEAGYEYMMNPTEETKARAQAAYAALADFQKINASALDDEGQVFALLSEDLAGYLPQLWGQTKASAPLAVGGAAVGFLFGNPVGGAKIGASIGTANYMYKQASGAAFMRLLELGVDEETARAFAQDEGIVQGLIEGADTLLFLSSFGTSKLAGAASKLLPKAVTAKGAAAISKIAQMGGKIPGWMKTVLGIGREMGQEYTEEFSQGAVSLATDQMALAGQDPSLWGLAKESWSQAWDPENFEELHEQGKSGAAIGLLLGGGRAGVQSVMGRAAGGSAESAQAGNEKAAPGEGTESTVVNTNPFTHTAEENRVISEYQDAVDQNVLEFYQASVRGENPKPLVLNPVSSRAAGDIKRLVDRDVSGFKTTFDSRQAEHINSDHGENGRADHSMADPNDVARLQYVLDNYDEAYDGGRTDAYWEPTVNGKNRQARVVVFAKKINGTYYAVEAVPVTKAKSVKIVSAYMLEEGKTPPGRGKKIEGNSQLPDAKAPWFTAETDSATIPSITNTTITQPANPVKQRGIASTYGKNGAEAFARITETTQRAEEGVRREFQSAYEAGLANVPRDKVNLVSDVQEEAYTAGRMDHILSMNDTKSVESTDGRKYTESTKKENADDGTEGVHLREGGQRTDGTDSQKSVRQLEKGAGRNQSRKAKRGSADREAAGLAHGKKVSTAALGIRGGSKTDGVFLVDSNAIRSTRAAQRIADERGLKLVCFAGHDLHTAAAPDGARGYCDGKTLYVRVDDPDFTAEQIALHEAGHDMIAKGEIDLDAVRERIAEVVGEENMEAAAKLYAMAYAGTNMTSAEIWEECVCDALGGMNLFAGTNTQAERFMEEFLNEAWEQAEASRQAPRGPPAQIDGQHSRRIDKNILGDKYASPVYETAKTRTKPEAANLAERKQLMGKAVEKYGLEPQEASRLDGYVFGSLCYMLNYKARMGSLNPAEQGIVDSIASALKKFPKYEGRTYRNLQFTTEADYRDFLAKYAEGNTVHLVGFTSTSKLPNGYTKFGRGVVHMVVDGASGCDIADTFGIKRQQEVIYLPDTELKVTKVMTANDGNPLIFTEEVAHGKVATEGGGDHGNERPAQGPRGDESAGVQGKTVPDYSGRNNGGIREEAQRGLGRDGVLPERGESDNGRNLSLTERRHSNYAPGQALGVKTEAKTDGEHSTQDGQGHYSRVIGGNKHGREGTEEARRAAFEGSGTLHWERIAPTHRRAKERKQSFLERMDRSGAVVQQGDGYIFGYRPVQLSKASSYAKEAAQTLTQFGVKDYFIFDGEVQYYKSGHGTTGDNADGMTMRNGPIGINNIAGSRPDAIDPQNMAAHEAIHYKTAHNNPETLAYQQTVIDNIRRDSPTFQIYFDAILGGYFTDKNGNVYFDWNDDKHLARFYKEFCGYVSGHVYTNVWDVSDMFTDYDAVHSALEKALGVKIPAKSDGDYSARLDTDEIAEEIDRVLEENEGGANSEEDIRAAVETVYQQMLEKYGAMKPGEKPYRSVQVPKRTSDEQKVSQTVRTILEAKATPEEVLPDIEQLVATGDFSYKVYTDKQAISDAENSIRRVGWAQSFADWVEAMRDGKVSKKNTAIGWALYNNAANSGDMETAITVLSHMIGHQRNAAQALQATRILKKLSPETQLYQVQRSVENLQEELNERFGEKDAPELKVDAALAEEYLKAKDQAARDEILKDIYRDIGRQMPSTFRDKWNAWRYLAMLGNARTHVRNILGNAGFAPIVAAKNMTATAIEEAVHRVSGGKLERSKALVGTSKSDRALLKAAWDDYAKVQDAAMSGGKYSDFANANKYIEEGRTVFKTKRLEAARRGSSRALDAEDVWFSKPHYAAALASYCKAQGITAEEISHGKTIEKARAYAVLEAQKATYRDTNALSQTIGELGRMMRPGKKDAVHKGVGVVAEGILPFRKTPANILARGLEYSPLGLMNGIKQAVWDVKRGNKTGAEAIDTISAGLTGTGLLALGIYMAAQGLIRGHGDDEEDVNEFKELMGHQAYSLEIGDTSVTLDWLAPECLPFFVGVNLWEQTKGKKEDVTLSAVLNSAATVSEPLLEMSCLQSLNDVFETVGYVQNEGFSGLPAALASAATSYLTQALPTFLGQVERAGEKIRMSTYTEKNAFLTSDMQYTLGRASARIPGIEYQQIPYIDAWGRTESTGNTGARTFNNFLNPAYVSTIETSKMEEELLRLYEDTGEAGVLPSRAAKYFTVDGKRKDLTAEEYVKYATKKGQLSYELITELTESAQYRSMSDKEKVKAVKEAYDLANQTAKASISNYETDSWVQKAAEAEKKYGVPQETYISLKTRTAGIQSLRYGDGRDKDKDGKADTIDNSQSLQIMEMIYNTPGLTEKQRKAMFEYLGVNKTVRNYNKKLVEQKLKRMRNQAG